MNILTSTTFWIILGAIILLMAIVGYLAEGTDFASKALNKKTKDKKEKGKSDPKPVPEVSSQPPLSAEENSNATLTSIPVVATDAPVEVLKVEDGSPSAWTDDIPKEDVRHEVIHNVPSIDDWSTMPTGDALPEVKLDRLEPDTSIPNDSLPESVVPMETDPASQEEPMFPDITPADLIPDSSDQLELPVDSFEEAPAQLADPNEVTSPDAKKTEDIWKI